MSYDTSLTINTGIEDAEVECVGNYTYNVSGMLRLALGCGFTDLHGKSAGNSIPLLETAVSHIRHPDNAATYKAMNPANGWGDHEGAATYLEKLLAACRRHPRATIHVS